MTADQVSGVALERWRRASYILPDGGFTVARMFAAALVAPMLALAGTVTAIWLARAVLRRLIMRRNRATP